MSGQLQVPIAISLDTHLIGSWVDLTAGLDCTYKSYSRLYQKSKSDSLVVHSVGSRYTDQLYRGSEENIVSNSEVDEEIKQESSRSRPQAELSHGPKDLTAYHKLMNTKAHLCQFGLCRLEVIHLALIGGVGTSNHPVLHHARERKP